MLGLLLERTMIRPLYGRDPLLHVLLTFGIAVVVSEAVEIIWGPRVQSLPAPAALSGSAEFLGIEYPIYRLVVLGVAVGVAAVVWFVLRRTNIGLIIRSGTHDREMVEALGINVRRVFTGVFVAGTMLAALAGVLIGPLRSVHPEMGTEVIVYAFIAVVVGGMGSVGGAIAGAFLVGVAELLGALIIPGMAKAAIYAIVVVVLLVRPTGLFGTERKSDLKLQSLARRRGALEAGAAAILIILPLGSDRLFNPYYLDLSTRIVITWIALLGYDLLAGYTGLVSFGHAMYFGLGAYVAAWTLLHLAPSLPLVLAMGMAAGAFSALIIGYLSIRTRGVYFILLTLAFAEFGFQAVFNGGTVTGGRNGLWGLPKATLEFSSFPLVDWYDPLQAYYLALAAFRSGVRVGSADRRVAFWLSPRCSARE